MSSAEAIAEILPMLAVPTIMFIVFFGMSLGKK